MVGSCVLRSKFLATLLVAAVLHTSPSPISLIPFSLLLSDFVGMVCVPILVSRVTLRIYPSVPLQPFAWVRENTCVLLG
jgi:hypothetical protein